MKPADVEMKIDHMAQQRKHLSVFQQRRRLVIFILLAVFGLVLVFGRSSQGEIMHDRIEAYGVVLIMIGIGGRLWSTLYVGGRKAAQLVTIGPYSITRNPLYLFSSVAAAGAGAQMGSLVATLGFGFLCAVTFYFVILREERFLGEAMGEPYQVYKSVVPRFFPKFRLYRDNEEVTFRPRMLKNTLLDGLVFFLSIPTFELIELAQEKSRIPILFILP